MEAKELRIGNYVIGISNTPEVIELISKDEVDTDIHDSLKITLADPIPLTEDWLLKFGFIFECSDDGYLDINDNYSIYVNLYNNEIETRLATEFDEIETSVKHVHQLQNLYFALTGEELTIKIC